MGADYSVVLCSSTAGGAERLSGILAEEQLVVPVVADPAAEAAVKAEVEAPTVDLTTPGPAGGGLHRPGVRAPGGQGGRADRTPT